MEMNQGCVTVKGTSPRVMCPSEASTCQRSRYSPGNNPVACVTSASAGLSLLISSACVKPTAPTSVRRERLVSIRTLNRSLIGTSGPATVPFDDGVDSSSTACADAAAAMKENAAAERRSFRRLARRFFMLFKFPGEVAGFDAHKFTPREIRPLDRMMLFQLDGGAKTEISHVNKDAI